VRRAKEATCPRATPRSAAAFFAAALALCAAAWAVSYSACLAWKWSSAMAEEAWAASTDA
jgi:hypothetical protein